MVKGASPGCGLWPRLCLRQGCDFVRAEAAAWAQGKIMYFACGKVAEKLRVSLEGMERRIKLIGPPIL